jgi:hypothetical protein
MTAITTIPKGSQIAPATERVYHQSNLLGSWKGLWSNSHQEVEFKVINIRGAQAQIEYTHNGRTERGIADVDGATITFGNVTIGTKDGKNAALAFQSGTAKATAILAKEASDKDQDKLVGSWSGYSRDNGQSAYFQVVSVDGKDAQVRFSVNGGMIQSGSGTVYKNTVMLGGKAQITSDDGQTGNVVIQVGRKTYSVPVTKSKVPNATSSSSSVNKVA